MLFRSVAGTGQPNNGDLKVERADVFAGLESLKQTGQERHAIMKGWAYKIVERPTGPNEFRYLRFAWKKDDNGSVLLGLANNGGWSGKRYVAGPYALGGQGVKVAEKAPGEWTVVTRDMFKDFGALDLSGILFSSTSTGTSHFDHILLGRSLEDLDVATDLALGKAKPKVALSGKIRDDAWADLIGDDRTKASVAFRTFLPVSATFGLDLPRARSVATSKSSRLRPRRMWSKCDVPLLVDEKRMPERSMAPKSLKRSRVTTVHSPGAFSATFTP